MLHQTSQWPRILTLGILGCDFPKQHESESKELLQSSQITLTAQPHYSADHNQCCYYHKT